MDAESEIVILSIFSIYKAGQGKLIPGCDQQPSSKTSVVPPRGAPRDRIDALRREVAPHSSLIDVSMRCQTTEDRSLGTTSAPTLEREMRAWSQRHKTVVDYKLEYNNIEIMI